MGFGIERVLGALWMGSLAIVGGCGGESNEGEAEGVQVSVGEQVYLLNGPRGEFVVDGERDVLLHGEERPRIDAVQCGTRTLRSLELNAGSELFVPHVLPYAGELRFHVGFAEDASGAGELHGDFRLSVAARGKQGEQVLWQETLSAPDSEDARAWVEHRVEVGEARGSGLVFRVEGPAGAAEFAPVFGNPRLVGGARTVERAPQRAPSAVVYLVDTLRADRLGAYGYPKGTTPSFDALADEGLVFENAYASSPWTKPSVASLFTSLPPSRHGVHGFPHRLGESETTLAMVARSHGLRTAAVGTNHWVFGEEFNLNAGFQDFLPVFDHESDQGPTSSADAVVSEAIDWLERRGDEPFLLYVHVTDPHEPYVANPGFEHFVPPPPARPLHGDRFGPGAFNALNANTATAEDRAYLDGLYDAEVALADAEFGRLVEALKRLGRWDETAVVVVADHGEEFLDHGGWGHSSTHYDEQVRIPLILRAPKSRALAPARVSTEVSIEDIAPTLCDLLGVPLEGLPFEGVSVVREASRQSRGPVMSELHLTDLRSVAVVEDGLKFVSSLEPEPWERAFRLDEDPGEHVDVFASLPAEQVARMRALVQRALADAIPDGYYIEVHGAGRALRVQGLLRSDRAITDLNVVEGEYEVDGRAVTGDQAFFPTDDPMLAAFELELGPGDARDLVRFTVPPDARVGLGLNAVMGSEPPAFLGGVEAAAAHPVELPLQVPARDPRLVTDRFPPPGGRTQPQVRLFRLERGEARIDPRHVEHLRALGYDADG